MAEIKNSQCKITKTYSITICSLLLLMYAATGKGNEEEASIFSSDQHIASNFNDDVKIAVSSSLKDTRTVKEIFSSLPLSSSELIKTTQVSKISSKHKRHVDDNNLSESLDSTLDSLSPTKKPDNIEPDGYRYIQPTKTVANEDVKIPTTVINVPGEYPGAPKEIISGPQKTSSDSDRSGRLYQIYDNTGKRQSFDYIGSNQNQIEQSLGAIAKIAVNGGSQSFRKSRDEENRKANPDIQDIITGIVKILHGKANGQSHHEAMRPVRPQPSRINNRGPPRISDLPPLEFDTPPSYIAPPLQPNRIPPPYPFDIPPSPPPSIPLPPQPSKSSSKLPAHPFIEGVPLPELLVPNRTSVDTQTSEYAYDTISMSEIPGYQTMHKNNVTINKTDKNKGHPPKINNSGGNKIGNKRVRPRPPLRPRPQNSPASMKPVFEIIQETTTEPTTDLPVTKETVPPKLDPSSPKPVIIEPESTQPVTKTSISSIGTDPIEKPVSISTITGIGEATPILETSIAAIKPSGTKPVTKTPVLPGFEARPGIVLDDTEYKPGGFKRPSLTQRPIITASPAGLYGQVFDVTVHAIQGGSATPDKPVIIPVDLSGSHGGNQPDVSVITKPEQGQDFVSIDGKRTYINLFGETVTPEIVPTTAQGHTATSYPTVLPKLDGVNNAQPSPPRRPYKKPAQPPVRIDTCIVGDDSTCDATQNERCQTEDGVSSCHCRPGYNRKKHRDPCRRVVSMSTSLRVNRLYDRKVVWSDAFKDTESNEFRELSYETGQAIASAMSMTPFSDDYINSQINSIFAGKSEETKEPGIFLNITIQLEENLDTVRPAVRHDIQKHLIRVIQRRNNNVGNSAVWVDNPVGSFSALEDMDECSSQEFHDCHFRADCTNTFGSFKCACQAGLRDPWIGNVHREGRQCESCGADFCNNRGECLFEHGQQICRCTGSFYGTQCEVDGEVLGVAIGASVAAAIIIILTLVCLCMWSRRWSREQKCAVGVGMGSPVFGFMANGPTVKTPNIGGPPYQISLEERIRWAQMADVMAHANHYAQPEPGDGSRVTYGTHGGYPTLASHTLNSMGSLPLPAIAPPVPLPRLALATKAHSIYGAHSQHGSIHHALKASLDTTSSSEEEDRADLLGRQLSAPRPKSRASLTNQSGIYYDVDLERAEMYGKQNIPLNTYTVNSHHQLRPFFR